MSKKWWALIGLGLSGMIFGIDLTIVYTALPTLQKSLSAAISELQWVVAGFGLTYCTTLVLFGRLGDSIGHRKILYSGMLLFGLASIGAGLSTTPWVLIFFRFIQGLAGGAFVSNGLALSSSTFSAQERGKAVGIYMGLLGAGFVVGPPLGGFIIDLLGWPWIFFINVPVIIISFLICLFSLAKGAMGKKKEIDWLGASFLLIGLGLLVFVITEGPKIGWLSLLNIGLFVASLVFLFLFYLMERKNPSPTLPFHLFRNHGFLQGSLCFVATVSTVWPVFFILPLYLQGVLGMGIVKMGLTLLSMTVMTMLGPPIAGHMLDKKGPGPIIQLTFAALFASFILMFFFTATTSYWLIIPAFLCFGFAWGSGNGISTPLALSRLPSNEDAGVISGAVITISNVAGVLFLSVIGTLLRTVEKDQLYEQLTDANIKLTASQEHGIRTLLSDPEQLKTILSKFSSTAAEKITIFFKGAFLDGFYVSIAVIFAVSAVLYFLILISLRKSQLKTARRRSPNR